ncbi:acyl-CoA oxidase [Dictyostelium discoideum AX4]|uniref:Peroxisomal acyl-coenzyme A oxidase 1 n=1 Tax=Dictyostelium discoideum TaxID=44689 RepID=ACOX1_DICDI|nr:acyl-CoA oxidase [Dictyostelium discoideum AX4]Q54GQ6.1 RecName: Full=Peroxisomal acyl-coenzyme A oxidase 1 [Dictyostelium discoideum]EAL62442.1 acyl-CoA oxidase [Dictyostelium discoideum AX4]|eukprot:XP_635946.1 acyl-CoA oxidase [Dictyostelium discoideum AX4]
MYCPKAYENEKKNEDLEFERSQSTFSVSELNFILNNNDHNIINIKNEIKKFIDNDEIISKPQEIHFLSREEQYKRALYVSSKLIEIKKRFGEIGRDQYYQSLFEEIPFVINDIVFACAFKSLASDEQMNRLYSKFENYQYFGSYSQTEIGHGSNVQGIETTCTFIKETGEFELNSPNLTSTKFWIGGLGKLATHTIVFAQLLIPSSIDGKLKNYGPHPFILQVRSLDDHSPLPGVTVGDIGPKLGFNSIDNGFLRLDHVRIPRENMLSRFFRVNEQGEYEKPKHPKLIYAGMVGVRSSMIENSFVSLSRAVTIAIRYSTIRKQFKSNRLDKQEKKIIEYSNQMNRIIPYLAQTFAYFFTGKRFSIEFDQMMKAVKHNQDTTLLSELHANSSGLKSLMTQSTSDGIESCRLSCGGHGYSQFSGLPYLWSNYVHMSSAEGESNLLPQQTTKYLLTILRKVLSGGGGSSDTTTADDDNKPIGKSVKYINDEFQSSFENINQFIQEKGLNSIIHPDSLLQLFKHRSFILIKSIAESIQEQMSNGNKDIPQIWSDLNVEINHCSKAHCQLYVIQSFYDQILLLSSNSSSCSSSITTVLIQLLQTYSIWIINSNLVDFLQDQYVELSQIDFLKKSLINFYKLLRPNLVPLVDSFDLCNTTLGSALGSYNGDVYSTLYKWASTQPFNKNSLPLGFNETIKPLINSKL